MLRFRWEAAEHSEGEGGRGVSVAAHNIEVFGAFTVFADFTSQSIFTRRMI